MLEIVELQAGYQGRPVVHGISLDVERASLVCLLGPSGCGKTTVLRSVAGFTALSRGEIRLEGRVVSRPGYTLAPERRGLGMVFQDNALFPHLSVTGNIQFGLRGKSAAEKRRIVGELLDVMGLEGLDARYPHELSGGQQQRVALARALAPHPHIILLDEPFSSLDVELRERLSADVRALLKQRGITAILVTHDQHEAFALSDSIGVMRSGRILQIDSAYNLYHEPADRFVADFIGQGVFLRGTLSAPDTVETEFGPIRGERSYNWPIGSTVDVLLRPDDVLPDADSPVVAEVVGKAFKGAEIMYSLSLPTGTIVLSLFPSHLNYSHGDRVGIRIEADHLVAFPA